MAHPSAKSLPDFSGFPQSKTLFISAPVKAGLLLTPRGQGYKRTAMKFDSAQAALEWCEEHKASLIYMNAPDPSAN